MSRVEEMIGQRLHEHGSTLDSVEASTDANSTDSSPYESLGSGGAPRRISLDPTLLRASGYLPEKNSVRRFADAYRHIKRPLIEKAMSGKAAVGAARVIMVTSALPGDGKTFTSLNLALSMSLERDISVLLVDCDVQNRRISKCLRLSEELGLMDALLDERIETESLVIRTTTRGLSVLPPGKEVASAVELLNSHRMRKVVIDLCTHDPRRVLLFDSAPLLVTNESRALLRIAGQVVLVVRAGKTPRPAVQAALKFFDQQQAGGIILNDATLSPMESYAYGPYGYDYPKT
jgi:protein-tyrosine kinase